MVSRSFKCRLLFIDDEQALLDGLRRALSGMAGQWDMVFMSDPRAALDAALQSHFDVIITDLRMPVLGGLDLLRAIRAAGLGPEMIILTGTGDMDAAMNAINEVGIFRFYTKPCPADRLATGIEDALAHCRKRGVMAISAIDALPFAAIALDDRLHPAFLNRAGADLLSDGGVVFLDGQGVLRAAMPDDSRNLHQAIDSVSRTGSSHILGLSTCDGERYSALVEPPQGGDGAIALIFLRQIDTRTLPSAEAIRDLFGLTISEARLAHALASGLDVKEAAESLDLTINSARTYLKRLFGKMQVNRQSELIRVLTSAVPGL